MGDDGSFQEVGWEINGTPHPRNFSVDPNFHPSDEEEDEGDVDICGREDEEESI